MSDTATDEAMPEPLGDHSVPADWLEGYVRTMLRAIDPQMQRFGVAPPPATWDERFVSRARWDARAATNRTKLTATQGNTLHWEGPKMGVFTHIECPARVKGIQAFHMTVRGWADIAYSSMICPHGYVFEGRWMGWRTAAQGTNQGNDVSYAHCFLGGSGDPWPDAARAGFADVIAIFEMFGSGTKLWPHSHWHATACPGDAIRADIADGDIRRRIASPTPSPTPPPTPPPSPAVKPLVRIELPIAVSMLQTGRDFTPKDLLRAKGLLNAFFGKQLAMTPTLDDAFIAAVTDAQRFFGLTADGVVGADTWKLLLGAPL